MMGRSALLSVWSIVWHGVALFFLPFLVGFSAALFFEVSQVADTLPYLAAISLILILPAWFCQMIGVFLKSSREIRLLREKGQLDPGAALATVARHMRIVTPRGWAVLGAGLLFVVCSLGLKWADLSLVAIMSLFLFYGVLGVTSFVSTFLVSTFSRGVRKESVSREMVPAVVLSGEPAEERFTFRRLPVPPGFFLLVEDLMPIRLRTTSRYALGPGAGRGEVVVGGRLRASPRGMYRIGPSAVYYQDVFGFTQIAIASLATAELKVLPRFRSLDIREPPRSRVVTPDVVAKPHRFPTEDHFRFREYLSGDDTRRINWKLSMRAGRLHVRQPETKEQSTRNVLLVLDSFLPAGRMIDDAIGIEEVLDQMVETWISLAKDLVDRGDKVTLVGGARDQQGVLVVEQLACGKGGHVRWQDLGARVCWQARWDVPALLEAVGPDMHAVVVSSRFAAPPPMPGKGQSLAWIFLPPQDALKGPDPTLLQSLAGGTVGAFLWPFRHPYLAGADENALFAQLRAVQHHAGRLAARRRLRELARVHGARVLDSLVARGDVVYRLEPGVGTHRLVGVSGGHA